MSVDVEAVDQGEGNEADEAEDDIAEASAGADQAAGSSNTKRSRSCSTKRRRGIDMKEKKTELAALEASKEGMRHRVGCRPCRAISSTMKLRP